MTPDKPSKLNGVDVPHDAPTGELLEQIKGPSPDCGPAFIALGCRPDSEAFYALVNATKDDDWHKRRFAAAALRFHPMGKRALPAIEALLTDEHQQVIWTTCDTMAALGLMSERLIYLLQTNDPKARTAALKALVKLDQKQVFPYVLKVFERETFSEPREAAATYLMHFVNESNWRNLVTQWSKDVQPSIRVKAVALTVKHGKPGDIDLVNDLLEDKDPNVRRAAYQALLKLGG